MDFSVDGPSLIIANDQGYTEDFVVVYNLFVQNMPHKIKEKQVLEYFGQFGEVIKMHFMVQRGKKIRNRSGFVHFANPTVALRVLKEKNHVLMGRSIRVRQCHSWLQPNPQNAVSPFNKIAETAATTVNALASTSMQSAGEPSILNLNDDCLEHILKKLTMRDQLNFARTCRRFEQVFLNFSKLKYKVFQFEYLRPLTLWQIRSFLELVGPQIEILYGTLQNCSKNIVKFLAFNCTNVKMVKLSKQFNLNELPMLLKKMKSLVELELCDMSLCDTSILVLKSLQHLKVLKLRDNDEITGKHIKILPNLEGLSLSGCASINSINFKEICRELKNLHYLNIQCCVNLKTADFKEIVENCIQLETLELSHTVERYECIAQLPKLKKLRIINLHAVAESAQELFNELAKYQAEQLEELFLLGKNCMNLDYATLVTKLKRLKFLSCADCESLDDTCLEKLSQLSKIEKIKFERCTTITGEGILHLLKNCLKLKLLTLRICKSVKASFIENVVKLLKEQHAKGHRTNRVQMELCLKYMSQSLLNDPELKDASDVLKVTFVSYYRNANFYFVYDNYAVEDYLDYSKDYYGYNFFDIFEDNYESDDQDYDVNDDNDDFDDHYYHDEFDDNDDFDDHYYHDEFDDNDGFDDQYFFDNDDPVNDIGDYVEHLLFDQDDLDVDDDDYDGIDRLDNEDVDDGLVYREDFNEHENLDDGLVYLEDFNEHENLDDGFAYLDHFDEHENLDDGLAYLDHFDEHEMDV